MGPILDISAWHCAQPLPLALAQACLTLIKKYPELRQVHWTLSYPMKLHPIQFCIVKMSNTWPKKCGYTLDVARVVPRHKYHSYKSQDMISSCLTLAQRIFYPHFQYVPDNSSPTQQKEEKKPNPALAHGLNLMCTFFPLQQELLEGHLSGSVT